ncbi:hypothetical protein K402DRAFT_339027 [Aulographum hederae CBS 113979]|uniref:DUF4604 domain-containing protein n=1 Tax=Aulographum hederae CBS 113979 TaxID=1176131 RepID=A0A6G1GQL2_9PEZI|nr:hypothetical protein K402DRAFT_339027 [Aulographum hederae CBS 113979]
MSNFKAKNLSYEANEPAFLRRLRGGLAEGRDTDRHETSIARPKRAKDPDGEDDLPIYVVEESNDTISKAEYEALVAKQESGSKPEGENGTTEPGDGKDGAGKRPGQNSRKRKVGKIIGGDGEEDEDQQEPKKSTTKKKSKKKGKPGVALSFDEEG